MGQALQYGGLFCPLLNTLGDWCCYPDPETQSYTSQLLMHGEVDQHLQFLSTSTPLRSRKTTL